MKKVFLFYLCSITHIFNSCENNQECITKTILQYTLKYPWLCRKYNFGCCAFRRTFYTKITQEKKEQSSDMISFTTVIRTAPHPITGKEHPLIILKNMPLQDAYTNCIQKMHKDVLFLHCKTILTKQDLNQLLQAADKE